MAQVKIDREDCEANRLPSCCVVCGEDTEETITRKFSWHPQWIVAMILLGGLGLIIAAILILALTKKQRVECPICPLHRNHWLNKNLRVWGLFLLIPLGITVLVFLGQEASKDSVWAFVVGGAVYSLAILIVMAMLSSRGVMPKEINDYDLILKGVHQNFKDEYEDMADRRYRARRKRRRSSTDDDYDDEDDDDEKPRKRIRDDLE